MSIKQPVFYQYDLDRKHRLDLISVGHVDDCNNDVIELEITQGGTAVDLTGKTATARIVMRKSHVLINDNVHCTINERGNILIPLDRPAAETVAGDMSVEVNITDNDGGLTLQFPLWVRVNNTILASAEVVPQSMGTIPELLEKAESELRRVEGYVTIDDVFNTIDEIFSTGADVPRLCVELYEGDYWLTYYDSEEETAHRLFDLSTILPNLSNYYNKTDVNNLLNGKANASHTHSQYLTQHQDISGKADASSVYTKAEVDAMISEAGGANVVNSVSEMVDTARLYVLASTGHIWRYTSTTVEPPNELSVQSDKFNKRVSGVNISGTTSSGTGTFIADPIAVDLTVPSCTVTFKNFAAAMASYTSTTSYSQSKIIALDANQTGIANGGLMMSRRSNNDEWQITASGDDMIGDLVAFADRLVTKGAISSKSQIKYITFSPTISSSSISSADIANMGIYISTHGGTISTWVDTGITYGGGNEAAITALDTRVTAAENNIAALVDDDSAVIPSYWQTEVDDTVSKIKALQDAGGHDMLCFGWCSDMHVHANGTPHEQYLGAVAARVMSECDIPLLLMTGDMLTADSATTASTAPTSYKKAWEYLAPIGKERVMAVKGNHDAWFGSDGNGNNYVYGLSPDELHRHIFAPQEKDLRRVFGDDGSYFYVDNVPQKTRFICLNSQWADYTEDANGRALYSSQKGAGFGQAQLDWLISKALNVETGYSVIIALHVPPTAGTHSSYSGAYREYAVIRGIIDAYAGKTTYSGTYTHSSSGTAYKQEGTWADVSVNCDFSSYHGTLLALFCGHSHYDQAVTNDLPVPIVCITSAVNTPYDTDAAVRVLGTSAETVMDFVCINRSTGAINLVRCGYGSDRTIN